MKEQCVQKVLKKHFTPHNQWPNQIESQTTVTVQNTNYTSKYTVSDPASELFFLDEPRYVIRLKCFALATFGVPLVHVTLCITQMLYNLLEILSDLFRIIINGRKDFYENVAHLARDIVNIIITPLLVIALEITAVLGLIFPLNARKIYSSIERTMINQFTVHHSFNKYVFPLIFSKWRLRKAIIAPCFQPKIRAENDCGHGNQEDEAASGTLVIT